MKDFDSQDLFTDAMNLFNGAVDLLNSYIETAETKNDAESMNKVKLILNAVQGKLNDLII